MIFGNEKKSNKPWKNVIFLVIGVVILVTAIFNFASGFVKNRQVNNEITNLNEQITNLGQENSQQKKLIEYFNSDAYVEEKARANLGLKKQGEKVVIVNNNSNQNNNASDSTNINDNSNLTKIQSNPGKWWHYFFK